MARYYSEPDELVDCHKCGDGKDTVKMEDDNYISIICSFCLGHSPKFYEGIQLFAKVFHSLLLQRE